MANASSTVCGILLEHSQLDSALKALNMDERELEAVMAASKAWPHPGRLDGWKLSHDAIRFDLDNFLAAIKKAASLVAGGTPLHAWQVSAFQLVCKDFYHQVQQHHDHEEDIFFPWMSSRVQLPAKMSADHKTLMGLMDRVRDICAGLQPGDASGNKAALSALEPVFGELRVAMRQHLEEEEIVGLPLLRKHFTAREAAVPEKKIVSQMKPSDLAWFLRPMPLAEKQVTMRRLGIPGLVQRLVMLPAVAKDERTILHAYRELAAGERLPLQQKRGFLCFAA